MSKDADSSASRGIGGGILHKASNSLRRSPSKKHRSLSSNPLPSLDQVFHETQKLGSSEHDSPPQKRPHAYRTQTVPLALQTTKSSLKEAQQSMSPVEVTMSVALFAGNHRRDNPASSSKSAGIVPQNGEHKQLTGAGVDVSHPTPTHVPVNQNSDTLFQHIHEMASKRISTLDYLRKAYARCCHRR